MAIYPILLDIVKLTLAGIGVVFVAFYLIKPYLDKSERLQILELKKAADNQTLPLRLQAYERITLLVERTNPANMLLRLNGSGSSAYGMYQMAVQEVRNEYQHNITQQVYVSSRAWGVVKRLKEETLNLLNNTLKVLPDDATATDFNRTLLTRLSQLEENPYDVAAAVIHKDLEEIF